MERDVPSDCRQRGALSDHLPRVQASMEMWLCVKRAISAAERAKRPTMTAGPRLPRSARRSRSTPSCSRRKRPPNGKLSLRRRRRSRCGQLGGSAGAAGMPRLFRRRFRMPCRSPSGPRRGDRGCVQSAVQGYRSFGEFTTLLDKEVGSEMADLLYRFKRYNPGQKLNLNFAADPPPLPEGLTEEMIEDYEGEDAAEVPGSAEATPGTKPLPRPLPEGLSTLFGFYPFGEVVNATTAYFTCPLPCALGQSGPVPIVRRPRTYNRCERFSRDMWDVTEALAFVTLLHQCIGILMHGWPKVSLPKDFVGEGSGPGMVATYTVMNFSKT
ncbi:hypothetical protein Prudu_021973 [Prunus dulcis]|uniref:Uncharacterized protein n=1 Tax=Prunus dulcis TaxID=3755 RepID=A0A4Y1S024_PRUDU|nr:hypothetical protein Prudu_021973 [Prunus dulcis]